MSRTVLLILFVVLLIPFSHGCKRDGLPGLKPGHGQVVYDGAPLSGATVTFLPVEGPSNERRNATAITDSEGKFQLRTLNPNDGIRPGDYIVTVSKMETPPPISPEYLEKIKMGQMAHPPVNMTVKHLIPARYASKDTTDLKYTIPAKGDKNIKLELGNR